MIGSVGKAKDDAKQPRRRRIPLNYYRSGTPKDGQSPFVRKRKNRGRARKYFIRVLDGLFIFLLLGGLVYSLLVKPAPKLIVSNTTYHSAAVYQAVVTDQLKSLKDRNKITFNEQEIVDSLQKKFPEIANVSIELPLLSETPVVKLDIAAPSFFLRSNGQDYIIDNQGVATGVTEQQPQIRGLTTLNDQSGFKTFLGERVLSAQSVNFINILLAQAAHANIPIKSLILPTQYQELDLQTADRAYFVKFYLGGDALLQTGQFFAARHNFDQTGKQPAEYLDVRVPGKIFYK